MIDAPRQTDNAANRVPDCVTEVRKGNTILTVSGFFRDGATETATDKLVKVLQTENEGMTMTRSR